MNIENRDIRDGWSSSTGYISKFQTEEQVREIIDLLDPGSSASLADIGCGNGVFSVAVARRFPACRVYAFDPLLSAVTECRRRAETAGLSNLRADVASANAIPLPDASLERILMRNALHHVADADAAYAEFARLHA